jgi:hypothetical protein
VTESKSYYRSDREVEAIVEGFEDCTLPDSEFSHPAHLTVALFYLRNLRLTIPQATARMRDALLQFLDYYGEDRRKYNETITLFWVKLVSSFLDRTDTTRAAADLANEMIELYGSSRIIYDYYSRERLSSEEARQAWAEPDVKPLDF